MELVSPFRGPLPPSGHLCPALLVACFGLDLTRALSLRLLGDGGCCGCCILGAFSFLGAELGYVPNLLARLAPGASTLHHHHHHHHHHLQVPAD